MSRAQGRATMRHLGFTLVELMIVVVIIGVLAVVAGTSYKKYTNQTRTAEVMSMFGELRGKEEAYKAENNAYCNTSATNCGDAAQNETNYWPALRSAGEPVAKDVTDPTSIPASWTQLGVNPQRRQLYCGYVAVAGAANSAPTGGDGIKILSQYPNSKPTTPWFYLHASCDNDGKASVNVTFTTAMSNVAVSIQNENK